MSSPIESIIPRSLKGHLALVTGATGGIGHATCLALAQQGCNIAAHYHQAGAKASALVAELSQLGVTAVSVQADLPALRRRAATARRRCSPRRPAEHPVQQRGHDARQGPPDRRRPGVRRRVRGDVAGELRGAVPARPALRAGHADRGLRAGGVL